MIPQKGNSSSPHMLTKCNPSQFPIQPLSDTVQYMTHCKSNNEIVNVLQYPYIFAIPHRNRETVDS